MDLEIQQQNLIYYKSLHTSVLYATDVFHEVAFSVLQTINHLKCFFVHQPKNHGSKLVQNIQNKRPFEYTK